MGELSDAKLRALKATGRVQKLADGGDLYIHVTEKGSRLWRLAYSFEGRQKTLAIGPYPAVSLAAARMARDKARTVLAQGLDCFAVVIEASWRVLGGGNYRSMLKPHAGCQSVAAFMARYRVPFLFAGSRAAAEYATWSILRQYQEGARRRLRHAPAMGSTRTQTMDIVKLRSSMKKSARRHSP